MPFRTLFYKKPVNSFIRTVLKPLGPILPERFLLPVNGTIDVSAGPDVQIRLACNPTSYIGKILYWRGIKGLEIEIVRIFLNLAKTSKTFIDIGANIGYYSLLAAAANPSIRVLAFEPQPGTFNSLTSNIQLNGFEDRISAHRTALADENGRASFFASYNPKFSQFKEQLGGRSGFDAHHAAKLGEAREFEVAMSTLDTFMEPLSCGSVDLIKIDTEGSEDRVLAGAGNLLNTQRPVIFCEVLPQADSSRLTAICKNHGYRMFQAVEGGIAPVDDLHHATDSSNDHIMVHADSVDILTPFIAA